MSRSLVRKLSAARHNPLYAASFALGNFCPQFFRLNYQRCAIAEGFKKSYFILSFDCDTEMDIKVAEEVHQKLGVLDILPSYAVPGELLMLGKSVYRNLKESGAEFINHGYVSHTSLLEESRSYISTVFYDQLSEAAVRNDIRRGHLACAEVLGEAPVGFRTPHFGTYQKRSQLKNIYGELRDLGYMFSTSTTPVSGMWHGPLRQTQHGIVELPVSGCYDYPARILDSWGFRFSPTRKLNETDYVDQFEKIVRHLTSPGQVGLLNIYADPSQVFDWPQFFECMEMARDLQNISFAKLVSEVQQ